MALGLTLQKPSFNSEFQLLYTANPVTKFLPRTPPRNKARMGVETYTVNSWEAEAGGSLSSRSAGVYRENLPETREKREKTNKRE